MIQIHHANTRNIISTGVRVHVSDLERSHCWYRDVLGLHMEMSPERSSSVYAERYSEDTSIPFFWLIPGLEGRGHTRSICLSFQVDDLPRTIQELKLAKVEVVSGPILEPGSAIQSATILDPDGHAIQIFAC